MTIPSDFSELKAWYRVENATLSTTEITALPDSIPGGATFSRSVAAPGPQQGTSANGLKTMVFTGAQALAAADSAPGWSNSQWFGMAFWFKATAETGQGQFFSYWSGTQGLSGNRQIVGTSANFRVRSVIRNSTDNGTRLANSDTSAGHYIFKNGVWQYLSFIFDGRNASEDLRHKILLQCKPLPLPQSLVFSDSSGTPGPGITTLRTTSVSPNQVVLGATDVDQSTNVVASGIVGVMGPDLFYFDPSMKIGKQMFLMNWRVPRG